MKNIIIVAGARPNFIKVAPLIRAIINSQEATCRLIYTGRNDDPTLEPSLFDDLQMPHPDVFLNVDSNRLNEITAQVMAKLDAYLENEPADVIIVVDDLASTMAAAIVAKKRNLKLAHLVAGTRSFDMQMSKEVNRLVIDALSDYLFTAGVKSNSVASREQADGSGTYMVGNILMDTLRFNHQRLLKPVIPIEANQYLVFTLNRKALLTNEDNLQQMLLAMSRAASDFPIIAPLRGAALEIVNRLKPTESSLQTYPSLSYLEFGWLTAHARGIITDSGNVAEEATFNGVPCITLNSYTEHKETVTIGTNILVGENAQLLEEEVKKMVAGQWKSGALPDRWDGRTAERILRILLEK